ncbi:MAG: hypothetical protein ACLFP1_07750 [Candidatus Goldiibacteriota bacterium]
MPCYKQSIMETAGQEDTGVLDKWLIERYFRKKTGKVYRFFKSLENNFITKLLEYSLIGGMTTGGFQKRLGKALGDDPLEYTLWSVFYGLVVNLGKYAYAYWAYGFSAVSFTAAPIELWGHALVLANIYRYIHAKAIKEPIGTPYVWVFSLFFLIKDRYKKKVIKRKACRCETV